MTKEPTPVHTIFLFTVSSASSTTQRTYLLGNAGKLNVKPFGRTKALDSEGILIYIFSSMSEEVVWDTENLVDKEL